MPLICHWNASPTTENNPDQERSSCCMSRSIKAYSLFTPNVSERQSNFIPTYILVIFNRCRFRIPQCEYTFTSIRTDSKDSSV